MIASAPMASPAAFGLVLVLVPSPPAAAEPPRPAEALAASVRAIVQGFPGQVRLFAKNLETGASYGLGEDEPVRTASTIKLVVMVEAFDRVARGEARWDEPLVLAAESKVEGAGVLFEFAPGLKFTLRDAVHLMIVVSDNTAANLVDRLGADAVNARMDALGLVRTRLLRKIGGGGDSRAGLVGGPIANKTGALDRLRSDVALVYSDRGRIAMAITVDDMPEIVWNVEDPGLLMISRLSLSLVEGLAAAR